MASVGMKFSIGVKQSDGLLHLLQLGNDGDSQ
jgi:hypothetical protein